MTSPYRNAINEIRNPPVTKPVPGRESEMTQNSCGHYVFELDNMSRARRFLILGSEGGSYYISENKLTDDNTKVIRSLLKDPILGLQVVAMIADISDRGLAPKVSPTLFALALAFHVSNPREVRKAAAKALPTVVRTNSHMLEFISYVDGVRGWGRLLRETVGNWYLSLSDRDLEYQLAKYRNRHGWTTRDALRMAKPVPINEHQSSAFAWAVDKPRSEWLLPTGHMQAIERASSISVSDRASFIEGYGLTHEMLPTEWLKDINVWRALMKNMPPHALVRNLGRITSISPGSKLLREDADFIVSKLIKTERLTKARVHPMALLLALYTYKAGRGFRGSLTWHPSSDVVDALDFAFYASWGNIVPAGKRTMIALDISGSMTQPMLNSNVQCAQAACAMAMVTAASEPKVAIYGFSNRFVPLDLSPRRRLDDNLRSIYGMTFGATDCGLPFVHSLAAKEEYDTFLVITDNETNFSRHHPYQSLNNYRREMGIDAKLAVVGMASNGFSIADPNDRGMLDLVGFDASSPSVFSRFSAGEV